MPIIVALSVQLVFDDPAKVKPATVELTSKIKKSAIDVYGARECGVTLVRVANADAPVIPDLVQRTLTSEAPADKPKRKRRTRAEMEALRAQQNVETTDE